MPNLNQRIKWPDWNTPTRQKIQLGWLDIPIEEARAEDEAKQGLRDLWEFACVVDFFARFHEQMVDMDHSWNIMFFNERFRSGRAVR